MDERYYKELANVRLERATELLYEAKKLLDENAFKSANNRAYYAMEKAVNALLISERIETKTHNGAMKMFNINFVRMEGGFFDSDDYRKIARAEQIRNASDYDDFVKSLKQRNNSRIFPLLSHMLL